MRQFSLLVALAAITLTGCIASKDDIRLLQLDFAHLDTLQRRQAQAQAQAQAQLQAQADAAHKADFDSLLAVLRTAQDSVRVLSARLMGFQANTNASLFDLGQQELAILERTGLSQKAIQALNAKMEERSDLTAPSVPGDTTARPAGPGPDLLFSEAKKQLDAGSYATGRGAFEDLIQRFPTYAYLAAAVFYVGKSYEGEGNAATADSVYQIVFTRYPKSDDAPNALYKHGKILLVQGKRAEGKAALQRVIADYPTSDAADLAKTSLALIPN